MLPRHAHCAPERRAVATVLAAAAGILLPSAPLAGQDSDPLAAALALERAFTETIEKAEPSVVSILRYKPQEMPYRETIQEQLDPLGRREMRDFLGSTRPEHPDFVPNSFGAGIIIADPLERDGRLILTNYHVVHGGPAVNPPEGYRSTSELFVRLADRSGCPAAIYAADPRSDLAVLKLLPAETSVDLKSLEPLEPSDASSLRKGQFVLALGNPYAMARDGSASVTWGMISNIGRRAAPIPHRRFDTESRQRETVHHYGTLLQVTMPLDLGTSGGPLLDLRGRLVGVTTSLAALDGYEKSAGHAVPFDEGTRRAIDALRRGYEVEYGLLGVEPHTVLRSRLPWIGQPSAVLVVVETNSPALAAGLRNEDVIVAIDSVPVYSDSDLMREIGRREPGSSVRLRVFSPGARGPAQRELVVSLAKWPPSNEQDIIAARVRPERSWRGLVIDYSTGRWRFKPGRGILDGVVIREVGGDARAFLADDPETAVELRAGDFITQVEGTPVRNPEEFSRAVANLRGAVRLGLLGRSEAVVVRESLR